MALSPALHTLLVGAVDYAGLFPPAQLPMADAVRDYAAYRTGGDAWALGRFIVPAARLEELTGAAGPAWQDGGKPWLVAATAGPDLEASLRAIERFRAEVTTTRAWLDTIEFRVADQAELVDALLLLPATFQRYAELPLDPDPTPLVGLLVHRGACAKFRTGGVTPDAFPDPDLLLRALAIVVQAGLRFKCTAGLHHPVRGTYPLTYAPDAPSGEMYGYLNLFLAVAALIQGEKGEVARRILLEEDPCAFTVAGDDLLWREVRFPQPMLRALRRRGMHSFGSCSFREPVTELTVVAV
jgi:hypothetical protein